jgi:hypothetical protein
MIRSPSDTLGKWFVKYGIWILVVVTLLGLIIGGIVSCTTGNKPEKKSFRKTLEEAEDFIYESILGEPVETTTSSQPVKRSGKYESKGEVEARRVLREYFNRPTGFNNFRPDFLNNVVTGGKRNLEIDCWEPELKLGVEYNGRQHYDYTPHFHKNKEAFYNQKYRDELKRRMCRDHGVVLIEIPYTVPVNKIRSYLISQLKTYGY